MSQGLMSVKEARNIATNIRKALLKGMRPGTGQMAVFSHAILALDRQLSEIEKIFSECILREDGHLPDCPFGENLTGQPDDSYARCSVTCLRIVEVISLIKSDPKAFPDGGVIRAKELSQ